MAMLQSTLLLLLAAVFIRAAVAKILATAAFRAVLRKLVPRASNLLAWGIPRFELVLGALLLVHWRPRVTALVAMGTLVIFTAALLRMRRLHVGGCGCFGEQAEGASIVRGLLRNALLIAAAAWIAIDPPPLAPWQVGGWNLLAMATVLLGVTCAWTLGGALVESVRATRALLRNQTI